MGEIVIATLIFIENSPVEQRPTPCSRHLDRDDRCMMVCINIQPKGDVKGWLDWLRGCLWAGYLDGAAHTPVVDAAPTGAIISIFTRFIENQGDISHLTGHHIHSRLV